MPEKIVLLNGGEDANNMQHECSRYEALVRFNERHMHWKHRTDCEVEISRSLWSKGDFELVAINLGKSSMHDMDVRCSHIHRRSNKSYPITSRFECSTPLTSIR